MSELNEPAPPARRSPLIWIVLVVVGLILFAFLSGERGDLPGKSTIDGSPESATDGDGTIESDMIESDMIERSENQDDVVEETTGAIDRSLLVPPGMRARQYIEQLRSAGKPYPLSQVFDRAQDFRHDGSLADAYLLYFFAARENHLPSMMTMGEMSDPLRFRAEDTLLDQADAIQAWKWYQKAAELGQAQAAQRLDELDQWARDAAAGGDSAARQLLLNIQ
jgi:TPR repeat protein